MAREIFEAEHFGKYLFFIIKWAIPLTWRQLVILAIRVNKTKVGRSSDIHRHGIWSERSVAFEIDVN